MEGRSMEVYDAEGEDDDAAGAGANEQMYFNIDPIPATHMLTFEEAIQRQKEILDKSSIVNKFLMPIWDSRNHTKNKFYKKMSNQKQESDRIMKYIMSQGNWSFNKIEDFDPNPVIINKALDPNKIINGR